MKGMTNALPVLIDASTLATKSDISDMETKTNANATFATKTALTTLQNATKAAVSEFAITETADKVTITTTAIDGATSKSEDIPAVTVTTAGIMSADWFKKLKELWDDAHPVDYTLTVTLTGATDYHTVSISGFKPTVSGSSYTFAGLQTNTNYTVQILQSGQVSVGLTVASKTPAGLIVSSKAVGNDLVLTVNNPSSQNATITVNISG